jgi:beta-N-acetylhexosaminidase
VPIEPEVRLAALSCLLLGFVGPVAPRWLLDALGDGLGGVVLFGSNVGDGTGLADLTGALRKAAGRDIVIALDEEGGDVTRLDSRRGSTSPGAAALGQLDDPDATESVYAAIGARLADVGVTTDLAPVADVNSDPLNPVIGVRSFSADPDVAARHVAAAVRGLQSGGVAACVKHFPGHGATRSDSHHEVAVLDRSRAELDEVDLSPFRAAVDAGARAIMTGHLFVPSLDPENLATISPAITTGLLRGELGFTGTVVTDALEMKAVSATIGMVEGFVAALTAGADAIETGARDYPELVEQIPLAVADALTTGRLSAERLDDAGRRTRMLSRAGASADQRAVDVAPGCLEVIGALPRLHRPLVIESRPPGGMASGELPWSLAAEITGSEVVAADATFVAPAIAAGRTVIVVVRDPHRHPWQRALVELARSRPGSVIVDVGWPAELGTEGPVIRTRGVAPGLMRATARVLEGRA